MPGSGSAVEWGAPDNNRMQHGVRAARWARAPQLVRVIDHLNDKSRQFIRSKRTSPAAVDEPDEKARRLLLHRGADWELTLHR